MCFWPNPVKNKQKQTVVIYHEQSCTAKHGRNFPELTVHFL